MGSMVAIIIAVLTIIGGIALKVTETWLNRQDPVVRQRDYRSEIGELIARIDTLEDEVEKWRGLYYHNEEEVSRLRKDMVNAGIEVHARIPMGE
jgi:predicted  nucleic acid-binding Zn-ribbon protein